MNTVVHADDFGISIGITDGIMEAYLHGRLDRVSIVPNGKAFDYAVERLRENPGLECAVHLNLVEGKCLSEMHKIRLLVTSDGYFRRSFLSLWLLHVFALGKRRLLLEQSGVEDPRADRVVRGFDRAPRAERVTAR